MGRPKAYLLMIIDCELVCLATLRDRRSTIQPSKRNWDQNCLLYAGNSSLTLKTSSLLKAWSWKKKCTYSDRDATVVEEDGTEVRNAPLMYSIKNVLSGVSSSPTCSGPMNNLSFSGYCFWFWSFLQGGVRHQPISFHVMPEELWLR